ncbi:glycosyltransferase [Flavobacterium panacagri]|uniref:glycosyltransferase n=1 Tax=Flavobacterium panacagri TaxID=3034146 RepID=UPI0025A526BB|nr:glycosyltransferase [Flavobacterium panacagri]
MKFTIITHVEHIKNEEKYFGYAPYVREMNIWVKYIDKLTLVAPLSSQKKAAEIDDYYKVQDISFKRIPSFNFINLSNTLISLFKLPLVFWKIFWAMKSADHIHLRCPGNAGLIGCFVQVLFPKKTKTAKYAGNWDPLSSQPWTYKLQKWILSNTLLTKNMQVLVYGDWENQSKNIRPFFTATYSESEKENIEKDDFADGIKFVFVGSLVTGKNPMYAIKLVERLLKNEYNATLDLYGEGAERSALEKYIQLNKIENHISLKGNRDKETLKRAYKESHFVILPSKSEGWPKAVAEGMFWGCIPISTNVSCVPFMLDYGKRGILLEMNLEKDIEQIEDMIVNKNTFFYKSQQALTWSQNYTTDVFEREITKLLIK